VIYYHCAKFSDFNFSRFGFFIMQTDRITYTHTHTFADVNDRINPVTTIGVSKER